MDGDICVDQRVISQELWTLVEGGVLARYGVWVVTRLQIGLEGSERRSKMEN
jgi:hypothetical protein